MGAARCRRCKFEPVGLEFCVPRSKPRSYLLRFTWRDLFSRDLVLGAAMGLGLILALIVALLVLILVSIWFTPTPMST